MIVVRNDDVLLRSSSGADSFKRFKDVHETICRVPALLLHVPTILTDEIGEFPEATEYIKQETAAGRMRPELHGFQHVDYGAMSKDVIERHFSQAFCWFAVHLGYYPSKWYTPWGANQPHLYEIAKSHNMELVDTTKCYKLKGRFGIYQLLSEGKNLSFFDNEEIIMHWWHSFDRERLKWLVTYIEDREL